MKLVCVEKDGAIDGSVAVSEFARQVIKANQENYALNGFDKPWCAYLAVVSGSVVGSCAFKTPPIDGRVEIAYFTFPEFERRGYATQMVKMLLKISQKTDPSVKIFAQTLPIESASTQILTKLNFVKTGTVHHPEDGDVWEWELR